MKKTQLVGLILITAIILIGTCTKLEYSQDVAEEEISIEQPETNYLEIGKELAMQLQANLGKNLVSAINKNGTGGAVEFCNIQAIPITDSMSIVLDTKIKRVTDKPRNENNAANEAELAYINKWQIAKEKGEKHPPILSEINGKMVGYYPIITNTMCGQCHGKPKEQIKTATLSKINKLYPTDKATGYELDEIRGIFVVEMNKNKSD